MLFNFHFYYPNDGKDKRVRFSVVSNNKVKINGSTNNRRTMGVVKSDIFLFNEETNYLLTLKFDKNGFYVNGHLITRDDFENIEASKTPEWPYEPSGEGTDVWTYPDYSMPYFQGEMNNTIYFGSMEGSVRSYAYYEYIMYYHKF